jgi:hypothetical protein
VMQSLSAGAKPGLSKHKPYQMESPMWLEAMSDGKNGCVLCVSDVAQWELGFVCSICGYGV